MATYTPSTRRHRRDTPSPRRAKTKDTEHKPASNFVRIFSSSSVASCLDRSILRPGWRQDVGLRASLCLRTMCKQWTCSNLNRPAVKTLTGAFSAGSGVGGLGAGAAFFFGGGRSAKGSKRFFFLGGSSAGAGTGALAVSGASTSTAGARAKSPGPSKPSNTRSLALSTLSR